MSARSLVSPGVQRDSTTPRRASFSPAAPTTEALDYTFDLCISDPLIIDPSTFALWLDGLTVRDAARARVPPREEDAELYAGFSDSMHIADTQAPPRPTSRPASPRTRARGRPARVRRSNTGCSGCSSRRSTAAR